VQNSEAQLQILTEEKEQLANEKETQIKHLKEESEARLQQAKSDHETQLQQSKSDKESLQAAIEKLKAENQELKTKAQDQTWKVKEAEEKLRKAEEKARKAEATTAKPSTNQKGVSEKEVKELKDKLRKAEESEKEKATELEDLIMVLSDLEEKRTKDKVYSTLSDKDLCEHGTNSGCRNGSRLLGRKFRMMRRRMKRMKMMRNLVMRRTRRMKTMTDKRRRRSRFDRIKFNLVSAICALREGRRCRLSICYLRGYVIAPPTQRYLWKFPLRWDVQT
jgi:chromosome segregation ATPase